MNEDDKFTREKMKDAMSVRVSENVRLLRALDDSGLGGLLDGPCIFCGYDGSHYWELLSHEETCPFHTIHGKAARLREFIRLINKRRSEFLRVCGQ